MSLIGLVCILVLIGVALFLFNNFGAPYVDVKIRKIINVVVVLVVLGWLADIFFGPLPGLRSIGHIRVGR